MRSARPDIGSARAILHRLLDQERGGRYISSFQLAKLYQALGDIPETLVRLERACAERAHSMVFLRIDQQFRELADLPRFQRLIELVERAADESPAAVR